MNIGFEFERGGYEGNHQVPVLHSRYCTNSQQELSTLNWHFPLARYRGDVSVHVRSIFMWLVILAKWRLLLIR